MAKTDAEMLAEIRRRFSGTGEEHDLLLRLIGDYQQAYDRGASDREKALLEQAQQDADAVAFARVINSLTWQARNFITCRELDDYAIEELAGWLRSIGKTPASLRQLAEAVEKIDAAAAG